MNAPEPKKLSSLHLGDHACFSVRSRKEQVLVTSEFIRIGLERNESCLFLGDPVLVAKVADALSDAGVDLRGEAQRGALLLRSERDYLVDGRLESKAMVVCLLKAVSEAVKAGFAGLRATGDVLWELGTEVDVRTLLEYEPALDAAFVGKKFLGLCQYKENSFSPKYLRNMLLSHPKVVTDGNVHQENRYYKCVESFDKLDYRNLPLNEMYAALK